MSFPNKYKGKCVGCGIKVVAGEGVCFVQRGNYVCGCLNCFAALNAEVADKLQQAEDVQKAQMLKRQALREQLGIAFDNPIDPKCRMFAWHDVSQWKLAYSGDGSDAEFKEVVESPAQSLYGKLRASGGRKLVAIDRAAKLISVNESVQLCD